MTKLEAITKIHALFGKTTANGSTPAEAESAMAMAHRLMALHSVAQAELFAQGEDDSAYGPLEVTDQVSLAFHWKALIPVIERAFPVKVLVEVKMGTNPATGRAVKVGESLTVFGESAACVTASWAVNYLAGTYAFLWNAYRKSTHADRLAREPFFIGLTDGMLKRFDRVDEELRAELPRARGAIVLVRSRMQAAFESANPGMALQRRETPYHESHAAGVIEGERIPLNRPLGDGGTAPQLTA